MTEQTTQTTQTAQTTQAPDWTAGLSDEHKGVVQNKQWNGVGAVLESYVNLEKLTGAPADQIIRLPGKDAKPEDWRKNVWGRLGLPTDAKGYAIEIPKTGGDPALVEWARTTMHEIGVPKGMGEALAKKFMEHVAGATEKYGQERSTKNEAGKLALGKEWGAAHDQNIGIAKKAAGALGVTAEQIDQLEQVMGYDGVMKFFHSAGSKIGEDSFISGDGKGGSKVTTVGALTPAAARDRLNQLKTDKAWVAKYASGDAEAKAEMERLQKWANPD